MKGQIDSFGLAFLFLPAALAAASRGLSEVVNLPRPDQQDIRPDVQANGTDHRQDWAALHSFLSVQCDHQRPREYHCDEPQKGDQHIPRPRLAPPQGEEQDNAREHTTDDLPREDWPLIHRMLHIEPQQRVRPNESDRDQHQIEPRDANAADAAMMMF